LSPTIVSVLTTKDGQGSTSFALSLAWTTSERHRTMLVDADMSGTGTLADAVAIDGGGRGIGHLLGPRAVTASMLEAQATTLRSRPRLRVVAGLSGGYCGPNVAELLPRLGSGLQALSERMVVLDLGAALAHPGQESPRRTGEAIAQVSQRVFIVIQDSPPRLVRSIQLLRAAQLPQAELVVHETRRGVLREQLRRALAEHLPGFRISALLTWDEKRATRAEDRGVPLSIPSLLHQLRLLPETT
jgi:hypothetical protein